MGNPCLLYTSEKSYKLYKIASERLVKYMKGDFPLIQLTPIHIQGFAKVLHEENLQIQLSEYI